MYQTLEDILEICLADVGSAEAHGMATGMLSVEMQTDAHTWLQELLKDKETIDDGLENKLIDFFEQIREDLSDTQGDFTFDLLLPDDDETLPEQVEALRCWCQGFLFGVGFLRSTGDWPGEMGEIMRDMIELAQVDSDIEDEDAINDLMELHEYVRAAVFTTRDYFLTIPKAQTH